MELNIVILVQDVYSDKLGYVRQSIEYYINCKCFNGV